MNNLSSKNETGFFQGIKETISKHPLRVALPTALVLLVGGVKTAIADSLCFASKKSGSDIVATFCDGTEIDPSEYSIDNKGVLKVKGRDAMTFEELTFTKKLADCPRIPAGEISTAFGPLESEVNESSARKCDFELPRIEKACVGISPSGTEIKTHCDGDDFPELRIDRANNKIFVETLDPAKGLLGTPKRSSASLKGSNCIKITDSEIRSKLGSPIYPGSNAFECTLKPLTVSGPAEVPSTRIVITREDKKPPKEKEKPAVQEAANINVIMNPGFEKVKTPSVSDLLTKAWEKLDDNTETAMYEAESLYFELGALLTTAEQREAYKNLGKALKKQKTVFTEQREFVRGERTIIVPVVTEKGEEAGTAEVRADIFRLVEEMTKK